MAKTAAKVGTKKAVVETVKKEAVMASVGNMTRSSIADQLAKTQVAVQDKLSEVGNELQAAIAKLESVQAAIAIKEQSLKELHNIEAAAISLDEVQGQIEAARADWTRYGEEKEAEYAELDAERAKTRKRDEEEYKYKTDNERRAATDAFNAGIAAQKKAEDNRKELLEKDWANREAKLKASEQELIELRSAVAAFPVTLKREMDREVAAATGALKKTLESESRLREKDFETSNKLAAQDVANCKVEIGRLTTTISDLHTQLAAAHKAAQDVATKALESASGRQSLETLQSSMAVSGGSQAGGAPRGGR